MKRVLKWEVPVDDLDHPIGGGKVLHVESQFGQRDIVHVWTEEDMVPQGTRAAVVIGTGHAVPEGYEHLGSTIPASTGGALVWHLYGGPVQ